MESKTPIIDKLKEEVNSYKMPKVLYYVFDKEKKVKKSDEKEYSKKIGEMNVRVKKRGDLILELQQIGMTKDIFKEDLELLISEQEDEMKELEFLQERYRAIGKRTREITKKMCKLSKMDWQ